MFIHSGLNGVDIGVGTGRFAVPLGIRLGVEPFENMARIARARGIETLCTVAENLPFLDKSFDFVLMVTSLCFFDGVLKAFQETHRVLKVDGFIVACIIDKKSELGAIYQTRKEDNPFYKDTASYSTEEITDLLSQAGFSGFEYRQTVFSTDNVLDEIKAGYGLGGFVAIRAAVSMIP